MEVDKRTIKTMSRDDLDDLIELSAEVLNCSDDLIKARVDILYNQAYEELNLEKPELNLFPLYKYIVYSYADHRMS